MDFLNTYEPPPQAPNDNSSSAKSTASVVKLTTLERRKDKEKDKVTLLQRIRDTTGFTPGKRSNTNEEKVITSASSADSKNIKSDPELNIKAAATLPNTPTPLVSLALPFSTSAKKFSSHNDISVEKSHLDKALSINDTLVKAIKNAKSHSPMSVSFANSLAERNVPHDVKMALKAMIDQNQKLREEIVSAKMEADSLKSLHEKAQAAVEDAEKMIARLEAKILAQDHELKEVKKEKLVLAMEVEGLEAQLALYSNPGLKIDVEDLLVQVQRIESQK
jgi:hypothetical protein